jgi:hypothetical protein
MKPVYAVRCSFHGDPDENAARSWELATAWLGHDVRFTAPGFHTGDVAGSVELEDGEAVSWRIVRSPEGCVGRLVHDLAPVGDGLAWRTMVWVCQESASAYGIVRSGPQNPAGVVTTLRFDVRRPRLLSDWIGELQVIADGRRLAEQALNYGQNDGPALVELLQRPERRLPVIAVSKTIVDGVQRPLLRPGGLAYRLAGNAHVVVVDRACSWAITEAIGRPLSVYEGAIRLWWPRFSKSDDPYRHTLVVGDRVQEDPKRAEEAVVRRVWRAAVDALGSPSLEARVITARNRADTEQRMAELRGRASEATEWQELLEQQFDDNAALREQLEELQGDVDDLRLALAEASAQASSEEEDDEPPDVLTVEDAVKLASEEVTNVVFLPSAYASARESRYPDAAQVLRDLCALGRVAARWAAGELPSGFKGGFAEEPVTYRDGISQTAATKYRSDYEIEYAGATVLMGPHLRRGIGAPEAILRIYWYRDDLAKQLVVGHVGRKLRDKKNA